MLYDIYWLCDSPSPYNDYLFSKLSNENDINLKVYYQKEKLPSHPWKEPMAQGYSRYFSNNKIDRNILSIPFINKKSIFIIGGWNNINYLLLFIILILLRRPYIVWTDTPNIDKSRNFFKKIFRNIVLKTVFYNAIKILGTGIPACKVLHKMGCKKNKIINFPYWTELAYNNYQNINNYNNDKKINFFSIGRLEKIKGYDIAIKAFADIGKSHNLNNINYFIIGDGKETQLLKLLTKELHIDNVVKFLGWKEPFFIKQKICEWDVFIHPSRFEPYGVVILESMANAKPVIASDKTMAALDRIKHNYNGFIFKCDDINKLAYYILMLINDPSKIKLMGTRARKTAEKWPIKKGITIIRSILKEI